MTKCGLYSTKNQCTKAIISASARRSDTNAVTKKTRLRLGTNGYGSMPSSRSRGSASLRHPISTKKTLEAVRIVIASKISYSSLGALDETFAHPNIMSEAPPTEAETHVATGGWNTAGDPPDRLTDALSAARFPSTQCRRTDIHSLGNMRFPGTRFSPNKKNKATDHSVVSFNALALRVMQPCRRRPRSWPLQPRCREP